MLVVVSDLHFEEESTDWTVGDGSNTPIEYSRNLPGKVYQGFISHLAEEASRNKAKKLDLVFAGDIFDVNRTSLWFRKNPAIARPYVSADSIEIHLEKFILDVLARIQAEPGVSKTLETFRLLANGKYEDAGEKDFPVPVTFHYIPGNHDRMVNATPAIRSSIRAALGLRDRPDPFPHVLKFNEVSALVRHGHEYDRFNFSYDVTQDPEIPVHFPDKTYAAAPFGDFVTIDIAARLPTMFRLHHGDDNILSDRVLRTIYERLLEFDDLRPQRAMLNFLLNIPEPSIESATVWKYFEPIIIQLLDDLNDHPFLTYWLDRMDKKWRLDAIDVIQSALTLRAWRLAGIPLGLAKFLSNTIAGDKLGIPSIERIVAREAGIRNGEFRFIVAGHTHRPKVELLANDSTGERYYIDTGTWRNRLTATPDNLGFGRLKALSYVVIYGPDEDLGNTSAGQKVASVDFWSGITQRWSHGS